MSSNFVRLICCLVIALLLGGCEKRANKDLLTFQDVKIVEYDKSFKLSSLLKKADGYESKDFIINDDDSLITLPNQEKIMINYTHEPFDLGEKEFIYVYQSTNYPIKIKIVDTTAPKIECEKEYIVNRNNEYFDLERLISISDNYYDDNEINLFYNGGYDITKVGEYEVETIAKDKKKNEAKKKVKIIVKDESADVPTYEPNLDENTTSSGNNPPDTSNTPSSSNGNSNPQSSQTSNYTPSNRSFLVDNYGSFENCMQEARNYVNNCFNQGFIGQADVIIITQDGIDIGYQVVFTN